MMQIPRTNLIKSIRQDVAPKNCCFYKQYMLLKTDGSDKDGYFNEDNPKFYTLEIPITDFAVNTALINSFQLESVYANQYCEGAKTHGLKQAAINHMVELLNSLSEKLHLNGLGVSKDSVLFLCFVKETWEERCMNMVAKWRNDIDTWKCIETPISEYTKTCIKGLEAEISYYLETLDKARWESLHLAPTHNRY